MKIAHIFLLFLMVTCRKFKTKANCFTRADLPKKWSDICEKETTILGRRSPICDYTPSSSFVYDAKYQSDASDAEPKIDDFSFEIIDEKKKNSAGGTYTEMPKKNEEIVFLDYTNEVAILLDSHLKGKLIIKQSYWVQKDGVFILILVVFNSNENKYCIRQYWFNFKNNQPCQDQLKAANQVIQKHTTPPKKN
jgi:hypothetical protein